MKKILILIICFLLSYNISYSEDNFLNEGIKLFEKKNMIKQNLNLSKKLYIIQKVNNHICILLKYLN